MATDKIEIVKSLINDVWNAGKLNLIDQYVSKNCITHDPLAPDLRGLESFRQFVQNFRNGFPDLHLDVDDIVVAGDEVYLRFTSKGTHKGSFLGMAPTNRRGVIGGMAVNRFEAGKIVESWFTWDTLSLMQQLGLLPTLEKIASGAVKGVEAR